MSVDDIAEATHAEYIASSPKPYTGFKAGTVARTAIETTTGGFFDFADPRPEAVHVADIAASLSKTCRFAGHVHRFYSVAEHALIVRALVIQAGLPSLGYAALHHDSEEAYLGDVTTPLKALLGDAFQAVRAPLDAVVGQALGVDPALFHHPMIVQADLMALRAEAAALKPGRGEGWGLDHLPAELPGDLDVIGLSPDAAEHAFLCAHYVEVDRLNGVAA